MVYLAALSDHYVWCSCCTILLLLLLSHRHFLTDS